MAKQLYYIEIHSKNIKMYLSLRSKYYANKVHNIVSAISINGISITNYVMFAKQLFLCDVISKSVSLLASSFVIFFAFQERKEDNEG